MPRVSKKIVEKELDGLFDDIMGSLDSFMKAAKLDKVVNKYCKRIKPATIQEVLDVFNEIAPEVDFSEKYEICISKQCTRISNLTDLISLKKLKTKRADLEILINQLEVEVKQLKNIHREVKN